MLHGKNTIITGATGGIGRALVREFAKNGSNIWACHRNESAEFENYIAELSEEYGVTIRSVLFDLSDEKGILSAVKSIKGDKRPVDALVNNSGMIADSTSFQMQSISNIRKVFDVNFFGTTIFTQYVSRLMSKERISSIINISSVAAIDGTPGQYEYVSSKSALIGATKKLALELAPSVRVNCIAPGIIETDMIKAMDDGLKESTISHSALKRAGSPEEVAKVAVFLASEMSSYITGQVIRVDGGMI